MVDTATGSGSAERFSVEELYRNSGFKAPANDYELCESLYYYTGGFRDNSCLIPHSREYFYDQRKMISVLRNYYQPIIDATVLPVFTKPLEREAEGEGAPLFEVFAEDVDRSENQNTIDVFVKNAATNGRALGIVFVVMDNEGSSEKSMQEAVEQKAVPYLYMRKPQQVKAYETNKFGKLTSITFCEGTHKDDKGKQQQKYIRWTDTDAVIFYMDGKTEKVVSTSEHGLGVLPVFPVRFGKSCDQGDYLPPPGFLSIARLNYQLYNVDSENRDIARSCRFPILALQGVKTTSVDLGYKNVINIPDGPTPMAPTYLSPPTDTMTDGRAEAADIVKSLYQLAQQSGVTGVTDQQSGVAKQWDFVAQSSVLNQTARMCERLEKWIGVMFSKYTGKAVEISVTYPSDFAPKSDDAKANQLLNVATSMPWEGAAEKWLRRETFKLASAGDESPLAKQALEELESMDSEDPEDTAEDPELPADPTKENND
jgi:hypothetical protein